MSAQFLQNVANSLGNERLLILGIFFLTLPLLSWAPGADVGGGDGHVIYAYVRSAVMDRDLQLENEYRYRWPMVGLYGIIRKMGTDNIIHSVDPAAPAYKDPRSRSDPNYGLPSALFMDRTSTGHVANQHAVGPAVFWLPFFLMGHGIAFLIDEFGGSLPLDGYSLPYTIMVSLGSALLVLGGMLLIYEFLIKLVRPFAAALAIVLVYLASPLVVYTIQTPISPHGPAAFACALFLFLGIRIRDLQRIWEYFLWGVTGGLMMAVRFESTVLLALPLVVGATQAVTAWRRSNRRSAILNWLGNYAAFSLGLVVGLLPQMVTGLIIYGAPWITFYPAFEKVGGHPGIIDFTSPNWWNVLWSTNKGLFTWHPILLVATLGLFLLWRKDRILAVTSLMALVAQVYVIGSWEYWHGATSFGQRFFVNLAPVFMIGLGVFLDRALHLLNIALMTGLGLMFVVWNLGLFIQYGLGLIPRIGGFEWRSVLYNQFVFIPTMIWRRILLPLSPWSFIALAAGGVLLLMGWMWWSRCQKQ
jgi:hypothetical protein